MLPVATNPGAAWREHLPFAMAAAAGAWLRLTDLGHLPLGAGEAAHAWAAWSASVGQAPAASFDAPPAASAILVGLQHAVFQLAGAGDAQARVVGAIVGTTVLLVPWLLRRPLGPTAALALMVLLAFDPLSIAYARTADGAVFVSMALWTAMACLVWMVTAVPPARPALWWQVLAFAGVVAAACGPLAWDALPLACLTAALLAGRDAAPWSRLAVLAVAIGTTLALSTSGFLQMTGPPLVSVSVSQWLLRWEAPSGLSVSALWLALARYETLPVTLGIGGLLVGTGQPDRRWMIAWIAWAAVLTLRPGRELDLWLLMAPVLLLSASRAVAWLESSLRAVSEPIARVSSRVAAGASVVLFASLVHGAFDVARADSAAWRALQRSVTANGVRDLATAMATWRRDAGPTGTVDVAAGGTARDPVLAWYLRDESRLRWVIVPMPGGLDRAALTVDVLPEGAPGGPDVYPLRHDARGLMRVRLR